MTSLAVPWTASLRRRDTTTGFAAAAMFTAYLPFSATTGALTAISTSTGASPTDLQWVTDAFTVALTGAVLSGGTLATRLGRRRATVLGVGLVLAGSLLAATSTALPGAVHVLQVALAVAGIGAGLVMAASLALLAATAPDDAARARAVGVWAAANVAALGAGPFLPGLAHALDLPWTTAYLTVSVIAATALGLAPGARAIPGTAVRLDPLGQLTGTAGLVAVVVGVITAGTHGWTSPATVLPILTGALLLAVFVLAEHRSPAPIMPPSLFRSVGFDIAGAAAATALFTVIGTVVALSVTLGSQGHSPLQIADRIVWLFAGNVAGSLLAGRLPARLHPARVLAGALAVLTTGLASLLWAGTSVPDLAWRLALLGLGGGAVVATCTTLAIRSVPGPSASAAGAANTTVRQLGAALGAAVTGTVLAAGLSTALLTLTALALTTTVAAAATALRRPA